MGAPETMGFKTKMVKKIGRVPLFFRKPPYIYIYTLYTYIYHSFHDCSCLDPDPGLVPERASHFVVLTYTHLG